MITKLSVFISSTSDLQEERQAVASELPMSFDPYLYERDHARGQSPEERLEEVLDNAEVFVGILGGSYGSVYPDCEGNPSIVEWEFEQAASREQIAVMPFLKQLPDAQVDDRQKDFRRRISEFRRGSWCGSYESSDEVAGLVKESLLDWLGEYHATMKQRHEEQRRGRKRRRAITAGAALMPVVAAVWLAATGAATHWWVGALGMAILVVVAGMWFEDFEWRADVD